MEVEDQPRLEGLYMLLVSAVVVYLVWFYLKLRPVIQLAARIPGPKGIPILGNTLQVLTGSSNSLLEEVSAFGEICKVWVGHRLTVFLSHPADIEVILGNTSRIDKCPNAELLKPWMGTSLFLTSGEKWLSDRKVIAPTFHLNILKSFMPLFNRQSRAVVELMKKEGSKLFDCHHYMSQATVNMLLESVMGVKECSTMSSSEYAAAIFKMYEIANQRQSRLWFLPDILYDVTATGRQQKTLLKRIHAEAKEALRVRHEAYAKKGNLIFPPNYIDLEETKSKNQDGFFTLDGQSESDQVYEQFGLSLLDYFIDSAEGGVVLTQEEIFYQINSIMAEGLSRTAVTCSFFLCIMAARPDIQSKVVEELRGVFGDSDRDVRLEDTVRLEYLERCIMETLRKYPPTPLIARQLHSPLQLGWSDRWLPAGCRVVMNIFKLHRNPQLYPSPQQFDPDNFLPERSASRHYYSFIPFSAGPRSCVGRKYAMLQMKILLSTILRNYRVVEGAYEDSWQLQVGTILNRSDGYNIKLKHRVA